MSILKFLGQLLKVLLPFLMTAAEKAFKKLPKEKQGQLIAISKLVEVVKKSEGLSTGEIFKLIEKHTGLDADTATQYLIQYLYEKGISVKDVSPFQLIWDDAIERTETGLKSLWSGISNIVSSTVAEIDWELLLMGVGEFVYRSFVKGKIKI